MDAALLDRMTAPKTEGSFTGALQDYWSDVAEALYIHMEIRQSVAWLDGETLRVMAYAHVSKAGAEELKITPVDMAFRLAECWGFW